MNKSYFATEDDFSFFGNGTLTKLLINFDCLTDEKWQDAETKPAKDCVEAFKELRNMGYSLFLSEVPHKEETLIWLDNTFDYPFTCNDEPTRYADTSDHWTTISRRIETSLCHEGVKAHGRDIQFNNNWLEICKIIKENDLLARTESVSNMYDDIDWNQPEKNGYIPVENMNQKTTELLKKIAVPRTEKPVDYGFKPYYEHWSAEEIIWDVKKEISEKYNVRFVIEQGSLRYRGTWLKITAKAVDFTRINLQKIVNQFCKDYGFDSRKEFYVIFPSDLPWPEGQKQREAEEDLK